MARFIFDADKIEDISDGYHSFKELYEFRKIYNAALFNEWAENGKYEVYKSKKHFDGEDCFDGKWFIVVAILPTGQISNHYEMKDWDLNYHPILYLLHNLSFLLVYYIY